MSELARLKLERLKHLRELEKRRRSLADTLVKYHDDPLGFINDCVEWTDGRELADYQGDLMSLLVNKKRACFRSGRGAGKSCTAALVILWFALTRDAAQEDWKVITTAGAWRQLINFLWPEVHKWTGRLKWDIVRPEKPYFTQRELTKIGMRLEYGGAMAAACTNAGLIEGAHADELLFVFDEAKVIPNATFDSAEGAMNTGNCLALMLSTPGEPAGRFYEIQTRQHGYEDWGVLAVGVEDALAAGQVDHDWVDQRRKQWGEDSALWHNHVLGEFFASDEDCVIPLRWAELAVDRYNQWVADGRPPLRGRRVVACDPARYGVDKTAIVVRQGSMIQHMEQHAKADTMKTVGFVRAHTDYPQSVAVVDVIGIGAGVVDRLREQGQTTIGFNASSKAVVGKIDFRDSVGEFGFVNLRAAAWWDLKEAWDPSSFPPCRCKGGNPDDRNCYKCTGALGVPENVQLMGDLTTPTWKPTSGAKYQVEPKENIRKRLGRSTDLGDAIVMANWWTGRVTDGAQWNEWSDEPSPGAYAWESDENRMYEKTEEDFTFSGYELDF